MVLFEYYLWQIYFRLLLFSVLQNNYITMQINKIKAHIFAQHVFKPLAIMGGHIYVYDIMYYVSHKSLQILPNSYTQAILNFLTSLAILLYKVFVVRLSSNNYYF